MSQTTALRALGAGVCALLILALSACGGGGGGGGGGTSYGGGGGGSQTPPLVITTTTVPYGVTNVPYQTTLTASGGMPPYTWAQTVNLPPGLFINGVTGVISGTPQFANSFPVAFQVTDSSSRHLTAWQTITVAIVTQLSFTASTLPAAHTGVPYDTVLYVVGTADPTTWKVSAGTLPAGLQLTNPTTNTIEIAGMPTQVGSYPITLQVQDANSPPQVAQQSFTLTVDNALTIVSQKLSAALINASYSVTLSAVNGTPPYQWSAIGLPSALTIDPNTGTISGVPNIYGLFQPTVTVADSAGHTASQVLGLSVIAALTIPNYGNQSAVVNKYFYDNLFAYGGVPPYTWSLVSGVLPPGLVLDGAHGIISGTPTQLGSYNVTLQATDTGPPRQTAQLATTFSVVPPQLYITGMLPAKWPLGVPVQWSAAVQGGTPPYKWNAATGTLPPGLSFDPNTGDVTGTPTTLGQYTFTLSATDSGSPPQTASNSLMANITTPLGRNDVIAHATPLGDGSWLASISPYADPPDSSNPVPDTDYYKIIGSAGSVVKIWTSAQSVWWNTPLDTVLEIVDANGVQLNTCRQPGDQSVYYNSPCLNDDIVNGTNRDSQLEIKVPGQANSETNVYAHVLDWRGDARPDMQYYLNVNGSVAPLHAFPPYQVIYGAGFGSTSGCVVNQPCSASFLAQGGLPPLAWSVQSGTLPPGMAMDPSSGILSGAPTATGVYVFVAQVSDAGSPPQTDSAQFTLTVETQPVITTTSLPDATAGKSYSFAMSASGGTPPYHWYVNSLEDNFTLQLDPNTGVLSGMFRFGGSFTLGFSALDTAGIPAYSSLPLNVLPGVLTFPSGVYSNGKAGVQYFDATPGQNLNGGTLPVSITMIGGATPPGLTFINGSLYGIPTTAGTYTLQLQATDSSTAPQTQQATYTITINP